MMLEELEQVDEDEVPIIEIGGKEPLFAIPEESEDLKLGETEEEAPDIPIDDERPPDLVNLLHDQELYEENPAWKPFQPLSSGQGEPQKGAQPAGAAHPFPFAPAPPPGPFIPAASPPPYSSAASPPPFTQYAAPARPSRQEEAAIPPSIMQALDSQQRMVDRLFDALHDLSRRVDEQPRARPTPTGMQAASEMPHELPSGPEQAIDGMPRWASDAADEEETGPEAVTEELIEEAGPDFAEPEASPTEPDDWLPGDLPTGKPSVASPAPPVPDLEQLEEPEPESSPEIEEAEPVPEPEPEELPVLDEVHELSDEEIEPTSDIRKELRDYIDGIRKRLEAQPVEALPAGPPMKAENGHKTGALLDYLAKLSEYLPEREKTRFQGSDVRRSMERIRSWLSGGRGPAKTTDGRHHPPAETRPLTRPLLFDAFSYLRGLAGSHPDPAVGAALAKRIEEVIVRIGRAG
jgi:hypothetical protein